MPTVPKAPSSRGNLARALGEAGEREYTQLVRLLTATQGMFALVPAASDFPVETREQLLGRLAEDLSIRGITLHLVHLTRERWDVLQALVESAPPAGTPAVLGVVGLENTPGLVPAPGAPVCRPPALALLNHVREGIRALCPFPLLLWCAPEVFVALQEHAPDFYDHFVGLTEFLYAGPRVPLGERLEPFSAVRQDVEPTTALGPPGATAAVAFYNDLLARHPEPSDTRARALLGWAEALWALRTADVNTRLTQALEAAKEALSMLSSTTPDEVARGQVLMGLLLSDLPTANQAANLRQAIACYEAAIRGYEAAGLTEEVAQLRQYIASLQQHTPPKQRVGAYVTLIKRFLVSLRERLGI